MHNSFDLFASCYLLLATTSIVVVVASTVCVRLHFLVDQQQQIEQASIHKRYIFVYSKLFQILFFSITISHINSIVDANKKYCSTSSSNSQQCINKYEMITKNKLSYTQILYETYKNFSFYFTAAKFITNKIHINGIHFSFNWLICLVCMR